MKTFLAGKITTDEELEEMLEHGNSDIFTQGVCTFLIFIVMSNWLIISTELILKPHLIPLQFRLSWTHIKPNKHLLILKLDTLIL